MNSISALSAGLMTDEQVFRNFLSAYSIIDIGIIQYVYGNKATVATSIFLKGKQIIYEDVEIIYPGNDQGVFGVAAANSTCLIFIPRSCMPNVRDKKVKHGEVTFSKNGIKAMPIGNGTSNNIYTRYDNNGNLVVFTPTYNLTFSNEGVVLQRKDANASITMNESGDLYLAKRGTDGVYRVTLENGQVQSKWTSKEQDVIWTDTLNSDGSRSFVQTDNEDNELFSMTIAADGTVTLTGSVTEHLNITGDTVLTVDGNVSVNADNINLNGDSKRLVTYGELKAAMDKLWTAMTTTPIAGNGSTQPSWTGITGIDISASETSTIKTGG